MARSVPSKTLFLALLWAACSGCKPLQDVQLLLRLATTTTAPSLTLTDDLLAVSTGHSYAFILSDASTHQVALIDAGADPQAHAIAKALAGRGFSLADVATVLLTHGHATHTRGLEAMPQARVKVSPADAQLAYGEVSPRREVLRARHRQVGRGRPQGRYDPLLAGERIQVGRHTVIAVAVPGHTPGSMAFIVDGGLVLGDAALATGTAAWPLTTGPGLLHENSSQAQRTLAELKARLGESILAPLEINEVCCRFMVDSHSGRVLR